MKTILAPVDFSAATEAVVTQAATLAHSFQSRVILLNVVQALATVGDYGPVLDNLAKIVADSEKAATDRLGKIKTQLERDGVPAEVLVVSDAPIQAIVSAARKYAADYIVMGSHGHSAIYELMVGSTTHGVLKQAPCPMIIIPQVKAGAKTPKFSESARATLDQRVPQIP